MLIEKNERNNEKKWNGEIMLGRIRKRARNRQKRTTDKYEEIKKIGERKKK